MNDDLLRAEIARRAAAKAESMVYSMHNDYLDQEEKALVEGIYQLPIGMFNYVGLGALALDPHSLTHAWLAACVASTVATLFVWTAMSRGLALAGVPFGGWVSTLVCLAGSAWFAYSGQWLCAAVMAVASIGILAPIVPSVWIFTVMSRPIHVKYRIAKRLFGTEFPFEQDVP